MEPVSHPPLVEWTADPTQNQTFTASVPNEKGDAYIQKTFSSRAEAMQYVADHTPTAMPVAADAAPVAFEGPHDLADATDEEGNTEAAPKPSTKKAATKRTPARATPKKTTAKKSASTKATATKAAAKTVSTAKSATKTAAKK